MKTTDIYTTWGATFGKALATDLKQCFSEIMAHYTNPNRHYHTFDHVADLTAQIGQSSLSLDNKAVLLNVALFHDVIYQAGRRDNERKSVEFATKWLLKLNMGAKKTEQISKMINATGTHDSSDRLTQVFLDMDLSILGATAEDYKVYTAQIRKEHRKVPGCLYTMGRKRFLKAMLSRAVIFYTPKYHEAFEKRARKNLQNELNHLKNSYENYFSKQFTYYGI